MDTSVEQGKVLLGCFFDAMNARDLDALDEFISADVVRHCEATPDLQVRSLDQFKAFMRGDFETFPDSRQTITQIVAEGNLFAVWASYEGTQLGAMGPFPATGKRVHFAFAAMFRIEGGKVAEWWVTWDNLGILRSLGHLGRA